MRQPALSAARGLRHLVLAAWPAPRIGEGPERIKQIAAWEPTTDTSWMLGRATREFGDGEDVYHLPRALFADWAEARLVFALKRQVERLERQYNFNRRVFPQTPEGDLLPGYLVLDGARREHVESAVAKSLEPHSSYRRLWSRRSQERLAA